MSEDEGTQAAENPNPADTEVPSAQPPQEVDVDVDVNETSEPATPQPDEGAAPGQLPDDDAA